MAVTAAVAAGVAIADELPTVATMLKQGDANIPTLSPEAIATLGSLEMRDQVAPIREANVASVTNAFDAADEIVAAKMIEFAPSKIALAASAAAYRDKATSLFGLRFALQQLAAQRTRLTRFLLAFALLIQVIILLYAVALSGEHRETIRQNVRTVALLIALLIVFLCYWPLAIREHYRQKVRITLALKVLGMFLEMLLFAFEE